MITTTNRLTFLVGLAHKVRLPDQEGGEDVESVRQKVAIVEQIQLG
jgi:hypothetical protein